MADMNSDRINLATHRATGSVWDRRGWDGSPERFAATRLLVGIGAGALTLEGLRQGTWRGRMLAGLGGSLLWWAITGQGDLTQARHWFSEVVRWGPWARHDPVHETSADSFPASDAPSWTPTVGTGVRRATGVH
jgi:hypothetical protein